MTAFPVAQFSLRVEDKRKDDLTYLANGYYVCTTFTDEHSELEFVIDEHDLTAMTITQTDGERYPSYVSVAPDIWDERDDNDEEFICCALMDNLNLKNYPSAAEIEGSFREPIDDEEGYVIDVETLIKATN